MIVQSPLSASSSIANNKGVGARLISMIRRITRFQGVAAVAANDNQAPALLISADEIASLVSMIDQAAQPVNVRPSVSALRARTVAGLNRQAAIAA